MSNSKFPLKVNLEDRNKKVVASDTIDDIKDTCTFSNIPKGTYQAKGKFADGTLAQSKKVELKPDISVTFYLEDFLPPSELPGPPERPPWRAIIPSAIGISLLSNFGGAEPLFREILRQLVDDVPPPRPSPQTQSPNNQTPHNSLSQPRYDTLFSSSVKTRLRACVEGNIFRLSEIPTLAGLLESLSGERESPGEFERQLIIAYTRVQQLQTLVEQCDPTLIQEILAAQEEVAASDPQFANDTAGISGGLPDSQLQTTVVVIGPLVNLRAGPSTHNAILEQVRYGTVLIIDQATLASLSQSERLAIEQGSGWLPVFVPDGRRGYIYSLYVTAQPSP